MKKVLFKLEKGAKGYSFVPAEGKPTKNFNSKEEGMEVLTELMGETYEDSIITPKNVVELLTQMKGDANLKCFKSAEKNKNEEAKGNFIQKLERFIAITETWAKKTEANATGVPTFAVCSSCGEHGWIFYKDGTVSDLTSKAEAKRYAEELRTTNTIDDAGKTKLLEEINSSKLPEEEPAGGGTNLLSGMLIGIGPNGVSVAEISVVGFRG